MTRVYRWGLASCFASCAAACGLFAPSSGGVSPADVAVYSAEENVCVVQASSRDAGEACLAAVRATRCGPGGLWLDAGVCPADGGAK